MRDARRARDASTATSGAHEDVPDPTGAGMDRGSRAHLLAPGGIHATGSPATRRPRLAVILLVALAMRPQVSHRLSAISGGAAF